MKIPRKRLRMSRTMKVAISVLIALLGSVSLALVSPHQARADVSAPSWWSGDCDVNNNPNSYPLGASYNGVKACGPRPLYTTQADLTVHFYTGAWGELEWECVELVMRYMYQVYGIAPYSANGYQVVSNYGGTTLTKVTNDGTSVPSPGDILAFNISTNHPGVGHTAVVTSVSVDGSGNGTVTYMQQNASANGWGSVAVSNKTLADHISGWLHNPNGGSAYADGTFIGSIETGVVYRMAGGAPIGLYNWAALPGWSNANTTWIHQSVINAMSAYPSDGTVISLYEAGGSGIYRFAGGAPLRLFNWGAISDCCGTVVTVNFASLTYLNHMRSTPFDGAVISIAEAGGSGIYRFVGGAPVRLYNWGAISDCCGHVVTVNSQTLTVLDHMNAVPANGSVISIAEAGGSGLYRFAGGAPLRLFNWGAISDCCGVVVTVNAQSLSTLDHMNAVPSDGTVISSAEAGGSGIYRFVGGAPIRLFNWGPIPGCCGVVVTVNAETIGDLDHMNAVPTNGAFLKSYEAGTIYRVAGGAPLLLSDPSVIAGSGNYVIVNQQSIDTLDHMRATPVDGTILEGLPSATYWQITGGHRASTTTQTGSVTVNDATVNTFPLGAIRTHLA